MAITTLGAIGAVGAVGGAYTAYKGAKKQAEAIEGASADSIAAQEKALEEFNERTQPFLDIGLSVQDELLSLLGLPPTSAKGKAATFGADKFKRAEESVQANIQILNNPDSSKGDIREATKDLQKALENQKDAIDNRGVTLSKEQLQSRQSSIQTLVDQGLDFTKGKAFPGSLVRGNETLTQELAGIPQQIQNFQAPPLEGQFIPAGQNQQPQNALAPSQLQAFSPTELQTRQFNQPLPQVRQNNLASPETFFTNQQNITDFLREQGQEGIQESAAARGRLSSGDTLKDLTRFNIGLGATVVPQLQNQLFNQQLSGQQFQDSQNRTRFGQQATVSDIERQQNQQLFGQDLTAAGFNQGQQAQQFGQQLSIEDLARITQNQQFNQNLAGQGAQQSSQQQRFNQLFNILGLGANAATGQGTAALNTANNIGNLQTQAGVAAGNQAVNQANAITSGLEGLAGVAGLFGQQPVDFAGANRPQNSVGPLDEFGNF